MREPLLMNLQLGMFFTQSARIETDGFEPRFSSLLLKMNVEKLHCKNTVHIGK